MRLTEIEVGKVYYHARSTRWVEGWSLGAGDVRIESLQRYRHSGYSYQSISESTAKPDPKGPYIKAVMVQDGRNLGTTFVRPVDIRAEADEARRQMDAYRQRLEQERADRDARHLALSDRAAAMNARAAALGVPVHVSYSKGGLSATLGESEVNAILTRLEQAAGGDAR